jgi:hypothetical protein
LSSLRDRAKRRAYRKRQRNGHIVLKVEVNECGLVEALIEAGRIPETAAGDRHTLELAVTELVEDWRRRWQGGE